MTSKFSDWWILGTALARAINVPRSTLISAVEAGHIPFRLLGVEGTQVVRLNWVI